MNLKDRRTKRICAMSASAAVIAGAGAAFGITSASANGTLNLTTGSSFSTLNLGAAISGGSLTARLADATFGTKVSSALSAGGSLYLSLDNYVPPTGVTTTAPTLNYAQQVSGGSTGPTTGWNSLSYTAGAPTVTTGGLIAAQDVFLTANQPGTYTFHFGDTLNTAGTGDDSMSPTVTMTVLDAENATSTTTSDDWSPTVNVSASSADIGAAVTASVPLTAVTTVDTRSSNNGIGYLAQKLAALVGIKFTSSGQLNTDLAAGPNYTNAAATTAGTATATRLLPAGVTQHAGTVTAAAVFDRNGTGTIDDAQLGTTAQTVVADNGVTAVDLAPATNTTSVANAGTGVVDSTSAAVTTSANAAAGATILTLNNNSATNLNGHRIKIGKAGERTEYAVVVSGGSTGTVTLASPLVYAHSSGSALTDMSATSVKTGTNTVTYTATVTDTDADKSGNTVYFTLDGTDVASLTTNGRTVNAASNIYSATTNADGVATLTVTDNATTPSSYTVSASSNNVSGGAVTATYGPSAAAKVTITNSAASLSPVATASSVTVTGKLADQFGASFQPSGSSSQQVTVSKGGATIGYATISDGTFSYTYTPSTAPTPGSQDTLTFTYGSAHADAVISWASSTPVASVALSAPLSTATPALAGYAGVPSGTAINGSVSDATSSGLAYKTVTLTGGPGVYFSTSASGTMLVTSLDVTTNSSGSYTAYAFFTKAGSAKITATSEGKTVSVTPVVANQVSGEAYKVAISNAASMPNDTTVISGKVTDVFGNPVAGASVALSSDKVTLGVLGSSTVTTNANGDWSTTFAAGADGGSVKITATINGGVNRTPGDTYSTVAGLTLPTGVSTATGTVTIAPNAVAFTAPASRVGAGYVKLTGTARPGAKVDVFVKRTGQSLSLVASVTASSDGAWTTTEYISASTTFIAQTSTVTSLPVTVKVYSTAKISVKALGHGKVKVTVSGGPSKRGTIRLYLTDSKRTSVAVVRVSGGSKTWTYKLSKGTKTFRATYTSDGCLISSKVGATVKVS